jgi:hypothetical protein
MALWISTRLIGFPNGSPSTPRWTKTRPSAQSSSLPPSELCWLTLAVSRGWPVHQLNVKNAFLHGTLTETIYCSQPIGFVDPTHPQLVCQLNKSLYGLKQAPRAWYHYFTSYLVSLGFAKAKSDTLFVYRRVVKHLVVCLPRRRHCLPVALCQ